jgi:hypothetical protein
MKYCILVLALAAGSAHATNIFYTPFQDVKTGAMDVMYLTDQHSKQCSAPSRVAKIETMDGKPINSRVCWVNSYPGFNLYFLDTNNVLQNAGGFGVVPGTQKEYGALMQELTAENARKEAEMMRTLNYSNVHP